MDITNIIFSISLPLSVERIERILVVKASLPPFILLISLRQLVICTTRLVRSLDCAYHTNHCKSICRLYCISLKTFLFVAIGANT